MADDPIVLTPQAAAEAHLKRNEHTHGFADLQCPRCADERLHAKCDALLRDLLAAHAALRAALEQADAARADALRQQLHSVKVWWTQWRRSLDRGAFTHSDGLKFLRRLDEMEAALAASPTGATPQPEK